MVDGSLFIVHCSLFIVHCAQGDCAPFIFGPTCAFARNSGDFFLWEMAQVVIHKGLRKSAIRGFLRFGVVGFARKCRRLAVFHCSGGQGNKEREKSLFLAFFVDM